MPCFTERGAALESCVAGHLREHLVVVQERIEELDHRRDTVQRLQQLVIA